MTRITTVPRLSGALPRLRPPLSAQRARSLRQRWQGRRRAMLAALLPTLAMMIGATVSLSAKAAPRAVDPYTDGARGAAGRFDVFTEGAGRLGPRDSFTQGGHTQPSPADHSA